MYGPKRLASLPPVLTQGTASAKAPHALRGLLSLPNRSRAPLGRGSRPLLHTQNDKGGGVSRQRQVAAGIYRGPVAHRCRARHLPSGGPPRRGGGRGAGVGAGSRRLGGGPQPTHTLFPHAPTHTARHAPGAWGGPGPGPARPWPTPTRRPSPATASPAAADAGQPSEPRSRRDCRRDCR